MIEIIEAAARVVRAQTRLPFRYGIAEMTVAPHVVVELTIGDGTAGTETTRGWASEQLPPKWFTKDPASSFSDDLEGLVGVVLRALEAARGLRGASAFDVWRRLDREQSAWAGEAGIPGLLTGLGTALVERALIDAVCRRTGAPFVDALHDSARGGGLGFAPDAIHPELADVPWSALLPRVPASTLAVRHTVGFADALTDAECVDPPGDGLPASLEGVLRESGVRFLKIKTAGDAAADRARLSGIFAVCDAAAVTPRITIDGNESMRSGEHLETWIGELLADVEVGPRLRESLIAVEQPVHRDVALNPALQGALGRLAAQGVAVIVDESDGDVGAVRRALDLGYAGGTYKGCKGVFRGLANAVLVAHRTALDGMPRLMTAEDLATLPPLTVAQDLVVAAAMGLTHLERNGHHYFGRLAPLGPTIVADALDRHPDLYRPDAGVGARLRIDDGELSFASALAAPFGFAPTLHVADLPPLTVAGARSLIS
jgi:hypothetical protein